MATYKLRNAGTSISLSSKEYVAEGGEGQIFAKAGVAYKVCFPGKMMAEGKIAELSLLNKPYIFNPKDILLDSKGRATGYTMDFLPQDDCFVLASIFSNTFRKRENLTNDKTLKLVSFMRDGIQYVHKNDILLVDLNEFNFLVNKAFDTVYFIDVNSYQTRSYKATAIMESIRDRHSKNFSPLTDWFSFGIVSFEMLIGIHPFRGGNHPDFATADLDEKMDLRMKKNVSVLNSKTRFPANAVRPFSVLPKPYLDWYTKLFEQGERLPPPDALVYQINVVTTSQVISSRGLDVREIFKAYQPILKVVYIGGCRLIVTHPHVYIDDKLVASNVPTNNIFLDNREFYSATIENGKLALYNVNRQLRCPMKNELAAKQVTVVDNRLYVQSGDRVLEVSFINGYLHTHMIASVAEHATVLGDGYITQSVAGSRFFILTLDSKKSLQVRVKELDGKQILEGKMVDRTCVVFTKDKNNTIQKNKIVFGEDGGYTISREACDLFDYQMVQLDNGLLLETDKDANLVISSKNSSRVVSDPFLTGEDYLLTNNGSTVIVVKDRQLIEVKMKK